MNVAGYLIERLRQAGLRHVFAVPGDYAGAFLEALDAADGIERIATVNELGAGYAADGYARVTGIGAACVQYGVGGFSILNATAGSFVERVPVAVISASPSAANQALERTKGILFHHSTGDLRSDQEVFRHVTVASEVIDDAGRAPAQIDAAVVAMLTHRRPIYIEVLSNVWTIDCPAPVGTLAPSVPTSDPKSLAAAVEDALAHIQAARLPVVWAGVEIQRFGLQAALQGLIDAGGFPFTTTSLGKTVLDEAQDAFVGTYAGPASPPLTRAVMDRSDCVIALGTVITDDYLNIMASSFGQMIEVTDSQTRIGYRYYHQVVMADFLEALLIALTAQEGGPRTYPLPDVAPAVATPGPAPGDALSYNVLYDELVGYLRREGLLARVSLVLGESTSLYVFGNLFGLAANRFVAQAAWGSLGHETGCALGVALGSGTRPLVVAGDGGFRMICQELSSLVEQRCGAVVFVLSNDAYTIEQAFVNLDAFKPGGSFAAFDLLPGWDYLALARAFGARGYRATTVAELQAVLGEVLAPATVPAIVQVVIPQKDLPPQLARLAETPPQFSKYHQTHAEPEV
jgi:indolepyruvate decarboxylase